MADEERKRLAEKSGKIDLKSTKIDVLTTPEHLKILRAEGDPIITNFIWIFLNKTENILKMDML